MTTSFTAYIDDRLQTLLDKPCQPDSPASLMLFGLRDIEVVRVVTGEGNL